MRALIFLLAIFTVNRALAASGDLQISSSIRQEKGSTGILETGSAAVSTRLTSFEGGAESDSKKLAFRWGLDQSQPDYLRYLVVSRDGVLTPLSTQYSGLEYAGRAGLDYHAKGWTTSLDLSQTLSTTPFPGGRQSVMTAYDDYDSGAKYALTFAHSANENPISYYTDPDTFETKSRPARSIENRLAASWEQVLGEMTRSRLEVFGATRPETRPALGGAETSLAYAFTDQIGVVGKTGIAHELRGESLFDDRGYLDAWWAQTEFRYQPSFRWELAAGLGTLLETESARGRLPLQKIGTDSLSLSGRARGRGWEAGLKALQAFSNTGYQIFQVGGDLQWQI